MPREPKIRSGLKGFSHPTPVDRVAARSMFKGWENGQEPEFRIQPDEKTQAALTAIAHRKGSRLDLRVAIRGTIHAAGSEPQAFRQMAQEMSVLWGDGTNVSPDAEYRLQALLIQFWYNVPKDLPEPPEAVPHPDEPRRSPDKPRAKRSFNFVELSDDEFEDRLVDPSLISTQDEANSIIEELQETIAGIKVDLVTRHRGEDWERRARFALEMNQLELDRIIEREIELRGDRAAITEARTQRQYRIAAATSRDWSIRIRRTRQNIVEEDTIRSVAQRFMAFAREMLSPDMFRIIQAKAGDFTIPAPALPDAVSHPAPQLAIRRVRKAG